MPLKRNPHIMIIAGEISGDLLAAPLMAEIKKQAPDATFVGVGGDGMFKQGLRQVFDFNELNVMGIVEVLPKLPRLFKCKDMLLDVAHKEKVDMLITIDAPDFNLRVAKQVKAELDIPCVHYVSPSVWAWRKGRIAKMQKFLDHVLALFPFEPEIYKPYGLNCTYVGHPVAERLAHLMPKAEDYAEPKPMHIALLPGSREGVIRRMLPVMLKAFRRIQKDFPKLKAIVPLASLSHKALVKELAGGDLSDIIFVEAEKRFDPIKQCRVAMVTSGTSNLEIAMMGVPMVVAYRMGDLTYAIISKLVKVPYVSPVNWVAGRKILPEFIQEAVTSRKLASQVHYLLTDTLERRFQEIGLEEVREKLSTQGDSASLLAYRVIANYLPRD
jgi:lipid-A-disaccharide synthase